MFFCLLFRSDNVVQGYIDKSDVMKELGAVALSVSGVSEEKSILEKRVFENPVKVAIEEPSPKRSCYKENQGALININLNFSNASLSAPLHFFGQNLTDLIAVTGVNKSMM